MNVDDSINAIEGELHPQVRIAKTRVERMVICLVIEDYTEWFHACSTFAAAIQIHPFGIESVFL